MLQMIRDMGPIEKQLALQMYRHQLLIL